MNRDMAWNWGQMVMRRLKNALSCRLDLTFCGDGTVVARFEGSGNERFRFDPQDGVLYHIATITQPTWNVSTVRVERVIRRLNRCLSPVGYFTVEPGWGITHRSSLSMLPLPEAHVLYGWDSLSHGVLCDYKEILTQIPVSDSACRLLEERTRFLDRMPNGMVYPSGSLHKSMNRTYEMMTKGVY